MLSTEAGVFPAHPRNRQGLVFRLAGGERTAGAKSIPGLTKWVFTIVGILLLLTLKRCHEGNLILINGNFHLYSL